MSDVEAPRTLSAGLRTIITQMIWICPLVAVERAFENHMGQVAILVIATFFALAVTVYWENIWNSNISKGLKMILFAMVISIICLLFAIWQTLSVASSTNSIQSQETEISQSGHVGERIALVPVESIIGKRFENERVNVDNKWFINCTFVNATLIWDGGFFQWKDSEFQGKTRFETHNQNVIGTIDILKGLGFLNPEFASDWKHFEK